MQTAATAAGGNFPYMIFAHVSRPIDYIIFRPWMTLINTTTIAITSKTWMNPPIV
jgi:hypothetical protein